MLGFLAFLPLLAQASSLTARDVIDHDHVVGLPETVPDGIKGEVYKAYQPYLKVEEGCVPFPAVDAEGNTRYFIHPLPYILPHEANTKRNSGGLFTSGPSDGDCSNSTGQVYTRGGSSNSNETDAYALMYAWYFPKDNPSQTLGHRHDWEGVIVWIADPTLTSPDNVVAVCPSAHGGWDCTTDKYTLSGSAPLIRYFNVWPVNHQCGLTSTKGGQQPLVAWESIPDMTREALETTNFEAGHVPFKEANWQDNLEKATYS